MAGSFGTVFMPEMAISWFDGSSWSPFKMVPSDSLSLHPGAHVLHYASSCFEGLKAFKHEDGSVHIFRMNKNIQRLIQSSQLMIMPTPEKKLLADMIVEVVKKFAADIPARPGSLYIRPTHIGTEAAVGKATDPSATSCLYVLVCPVGNYFEGGDKALRLLLDENPRCAAHMGMVKSGSNYASALNPIRKAHAEYHADQILFCPNGQVEETGATNFLLIDGNEIITHELEESFLHGVTRESILTLAADLGMKVTECKLTVEELLERAVKPGAEAAMSGTAAVLAPAGTLIYQGKEYQVGNGQPGPITIKLRHALNDIQWGVSEDKHGWLTRV